MKSSSRCNSQTSPELSRPNNCNPLSFFSPSDPNIQEYLNNIIIQNNGGFHAHDAMEYFSPSPKSMSFQSSSLDDPTSEGNINEDLFTSGDYNSANNANLLRDIESLIQNMERKQTRDNDSTMLESIDNILGNIKLNESRPHSPQSNLSVEPIRMKSPIMFPRSSDDKIKNDFHDIFDDIRSFVSNNIQDVVPDLVSQVEHELTTDLKDEENYNTAMLNLDEFLRNRHDEEFDERNFSHREKVVSHGSSLEDFFRNRHNEEFDERNLSPYATKALSSSDAGSNHDIHDFLLERQDEEYFERNDIASHDSITAPSQEDVGVNNHNLIADTTTENEGEANVNDTAESVANEGREAPPIETLKYKSSFNLRILKRPAKRPKSERDFKRRNSLILENVLMGRNALTGLKKPRPKSTVLSTEEAVDAQGNAPSVSELNASENNINHPASFSENSGENLDENEINVSDSDRNVEIVGGDINGGESLPPAQNEVIETIVEVVEIIINDEIESAPSVINDENAQGSGTATTSRAMWSENIAATTENDPSKAPQNLSELVEDTQRLIKQMKDEINAIYVSDDELSSSDRSEYSDDWVDEFEGEELEDEYTDDDEDESEYEDWSGEYIGSENVPDDGGEQYHDDPDLTDNILIPDNPNLPEIRIIGDDPTEANEMENAAEADSVVHGKLELTPLSSNQFKVDANIEMRSDDSGTTLNDNDSDLNNSTSLQTEEANDEADAQVSAVETDSTLPAHNDESINNEIKEPANSIKEIVNEAINDVISVISFDKADDNVSQGSDNGAQIAGGSLQHDSAIIDSAMNNSEIPQAEATPKVYDSSSDSITSGNLLLNDDVNGGEIAIVSTEAASSDESEKVVTLNDDGDADRLKNDDASERSENVESLITDANVDANRVEIADEVAESAEIIEVAPKVEDSNPTHKGAIAKSKIPAKIKNVKRKNSTAKESDNPSGGSAAKSKSSSPEKIKEPLKTAPQTSRKNSLESARKNSFDGGLRKKSVGAPFGLLVSSNVKNLQKEFLNKANVPAPPKTQPTKLKPSKFSSSKSLANEPAPTFANKLTKLITPSSSTEKSKQMGKEEKPPQRDHSKDLVPEKKYMEHCFSDEYPSTDDEKGEEDMEAPKSFFIKMPPARDSDDETSDVRTEILVKFPACVLVGGCQMALSQLKFKNYFANLLKKLLKERKII